MLSDRKTWGKIGTPLSLNFFQSQMQRVRFALTMHCQMK